MKTKKPQRMLTIIGIILIFCSLISYVLGDQYYKMQDISQTIEDSFGELSKDKNFDVVIRYGFKGYKVFVKLFEGGNVFKVASRCGCVGTDFLISFKEEHADIDEQIYEYHFNFLEYYKSNYSDSVYYPTAYTAQYINDQNEASIYQIKLALRKGQGNSEDEAKTYLEYLNEWSTRQFYPSTYPYNRISLNGEHYKIQVNKDNTYTIEPVNDNDSQRNPDSTLTWYMDEYASPFFTLSNVGMKVTSVDSGNSVEINFRYTNNNKPYSEDALIVFYIYNERGEVIDRISSYIASMKPNESKDIIVSEVYTDEIPYDFRIAYISVRGLDVVFE